MVSSHDDGDGGGDCSGYLFSSHSMMCSPLLSCLPPAMASLLGALGPLPPFLNTLQIRLHYIYKRFNEWGKSDS